MLLLLHCLLFDAVGADLEAVALVLERGRTRIRRQVLRLLLHLRSSARPVHFSLATPIPHAARALRVPCAPRHVDPGRSRQRGRRDRTDRGRGASFNANFELSQSI